MPPCHACGGKNSGRGWPVKVFDDSYSSDLSDVAFFVCRHFVCFTALACSDRLKQIFLIVPALPLFGEPDEAWRDL